MKYLPRIVKQTAYETNALKLYGEISIDGKNVQDKLRINRNANRNVSQLEVNGIKYCTGDHVEQIQTHYTKRLNGGDIGKILMIDHAERSIYVRMPYSQLVKYNDDELTEIKLLANSAENEIEIDYPIVKYNDTYYLSPTNDSTANFYQLPSAITVLQSLRKITNSTELFLKDGEKLIMPIACTKLYHYDSFCTFNRRSWVLYELSCKKSENITKLNEKIIGDNLFKGDYRYFTYLNHYTCVDEKNIHVLSSKDYEISRNREQTSSSNDLVRSHGTVLTALKQKVDSKNNISVDEPEIFTTQHYIKFIILSKLAQYSSFRLHDFEEFCLITLSVSFVFFFCSFWHHTPLIFLALSQNYLPTIIMQSPLLRIFVLSLLAAISSLLALYMLPLPSQVNEFTDWKLLNEVVKPQSFAIHNALKSIFMVQSKDQQEFSVPSKMVWTTFDENDEDKTLKEDLLQSLKNVFTTNELLDPSPILHLCLCPISGELIQTPVRYVGDLNLDKDIVYDKSHLLQLLQIMNTDKPKELSESFDYKPNEFMTSILTICNQHLQTTQAKGVGVDKNVEKKAEDYLKRKFSRSDNTSLLKPETHVKRPNDLRATLFLPADAKYYATMGL